MIKLKEILLENIGGDLEKIINQIKDLPDVDIDSDLWQKKNYKRELLSYFTFLLQQSQKSKKLQSLLSTEDLTGSPREIYNRINSPKHPIRQQLITMSVGLD